MASLSELVLASWMTLAAVGIVVALPSAPGFFGVYHSACRLVLVQLGLSAESALALGMLLHAVFWVTMTLLGLVALRWGQSSLGDLGRGVAPRSAALPAPRRPGDPLPPPELVFRCPFRGFRAVP